LGCSGLVCAIVADQGWLCPKGDAYGRGYHFGMDAVGQPIPGIMHKPIENAGGGRSKDEVPITQVDMLNAMSGIESYRRFI